MFKRLNVWYDNLREPKRFLLFMSTCGPAITLSNWALYHQYHPILCSIPLMFFIVWAFTRI